MKEIFSAASIFAILFYVAINLGFHSAQNSKIDPSLWIPACIKLNSYLSKSENQEKQLSEVSNFHSNNSEKDISLPSSEPGNDLKSIKVIPDSLLSKNDSTKSQADSLLSGKDSLNAKQDTLDAYSQDSTARIQNFHYQRNPSPVSTLGKPYLPRFYAQPAPGMITRSVEIDSTGKFVEIKEEINGVPYKTILKIPLKEYIDLQLALNEKKDWEQIGNNYELKSSKKELGQLIKNITDFEIPLPSVGVLSIFGTPKISLKIGGAIDIHGAWRNETTQGITTSLLGNTRNEPDFSQTVQVTVDGTIGDKLNIKADWNTERQFQYENQLKIKYTGYEDEIIQSIEAGNVSLQTTPLIGGSEALFGLKAKFKLGPLTLTTLASQKKGQIKEVNVSGGATSSDFNLRAYDYSTNHYFIDTLYASPYLHIFSDYYGGATAIVHEQYRVTNIEVWKSVNNTIINTATERKANAYIDLPAIRAGQSYSDNLRNEITPVPGQSETGRFVLLDPNTDYDFNNATGLITFKTQIQDQDVIAVAYRVQNDPSTTADDDYYGELLQNAKADTSQRLILKLVKPANLQPQYARAWKLLAKNFYPLGGRNINQDGFELHIKYESSGQEPVTQLQVGSNTVKLLNAFGLDNVNQASEPTPDDIFDYRKGYTIIPETGEIIFPTLEPFGRNLSSQLPDSLKYQSIYDTTKTFARQDKTKDKWEIVGKYSGTASSTYQLGFNIVQNSVRVVLDGNELKEGVDYVVDYNIGQLTIKKDAALVPGANLKITYEQNDLFQLASKTLLGARGVLDLSDKTKLGFSILNLNQQSLNQKVRIGEEPLSNTIYGVDFNTSVDLPFFTNLLDKIISTREMSTITLSGEYAYIKPDPNTIKSTIPDDNGQSIAYVDDFEGSKTIIPIGMNYTSWKDISPPVDLPNLPAGITPREMMNYKGKAFWFSVLPPDVTVQQIWGTHKQVATQNQQVSVLDFAFIPDTMGAYNYWPDLKTNIKQDWGGMMQLLSSTANNLVESNTQYIEFWMNSRNAPNDAKIYIDLGRISEDVLPNGDLNGESKLGLDVLQQGEDTGIDGLTDAQEGDTLYNKYLQGTPPTNGNTGDPSGDDFVPNQVSSGTINPFDYFHINGTEGNAALTDIGRIPDTEDLNRNGNLDQANSFFRYEIPVDTTPNASMPTGYNNKFIATAGENGWYLYRIPLKDTLSQIGSPSFSDVQTIRLFATNATSKERFRIAEFNLVGNQWQKVLPLDSVMEVSVINIEDNWGRYTMPPGIFQERDNTRPDQNVLQNEQSLDLIVKDLPKGKSREAVKYLTAPLDVFNYSEMKFFIHGDVDTSPPSLSSSDPTDYNAEVYFRFGTDTNNYYEYRQPIRPGWNDVDIKFNELTSLKAQSDSLNQIVTLPVPGSPGSFYALKGNPTLTSVRFLLFGVYNKGSSTRTQPASGEVWIDELRVIGADNHPGWAYNFATSMKLADLGTVNFNIQGRSPYFHQLSDRFGNRIESKNWAVSADLNVIKLLPISLPGSSFSLSYSHTESLGQPLYEPGTDILVSDAAKRLDALGDSNHTGMTGAQLIAQARTYSTSDTWNASNIKFRIPSNLWWIRDSFNALSYGFSYNKSFLTSPTIESNNAWQWSANLNYNLTLGLDYYIKLADIPVIGSIVNFLSDYKDVRFYYLPQSISWNITANRSRSTNIPRPQDNSALNPITSRDFRTTRSFNLGWRLSDGGFLNLSTNYNLTVYSSLAFLETDAAGNQKTESQIWSEIFSGKSFGRDYQYQQSIDVKANPKLPSIWDIDKYFTLSAGYSVRYQWQYDFRQTNLGRSVGYNNRTTVGLTLRWKALTAPLFQSAEEREKEENRTENNIQTTNRSRTGRLRVITGNEQIDLNNIFNKSDKGQELNENKETVAKDTSKIKESSLKRGLLFLRDVAKSILFDYETINFNFSSQNTVSKSGIKATRTGFFNFFGFGNNPANGPSRSFMFGLDPYAGPRAPDGSLQDVFSQQNNLDFGTSRPLWKGAKIDLKWQVGWTINKSTSLTTDDFGVPTVSYISETGTLTRSFLSLPPVLLFKGFNSSIQKVHDLYDPNAPDPVANLSDAFIKGFETLPLASNLGFLSTVAKYIPRPNWHITWDGLQNLLFFKNIAENISLDHAYTSTYTEGWKITPDGQKQIQTQTVEYGFTPLVGLNFTFAKLWSGNLIASIKYSTKTSYNLGISTRSIIESFSKDIGVTAGYSKSGFEIPFFGVSLKNDIEFNLSYTKSVTSSTIYDMTDFTDAGIPQDGITRTIVGPTIKYTISSRVQLSIFYTRTTVTPEGAQRTPPSVLNQAGLDVHITIQ